MFTQFDLSTVYLFGALVGLLLVGIMGFAYFRLATYAGFGPWVLSIASYSVGLMTYWLISVHPAPFVVLIGNLCFVATPSLALLGTARFFGRRIGSWVVWAPVVVGFLASAVLSLVVENRSLRIVLVSLVIALTQVVHLWLIRTSRSKLAIGSAANCLTFFLWIYLSYVAVRTGYIALGFEAQSTSLVVNGAFQAATYAVTCLSNVGMVFGYLALTIARTETRLVESEMRYRILIEQSPESVVVHRDGLVVYANPAALRMFGAAGAQDLIGRPYLDRIHPEFHADVLARRKGILELGVGGPLAEMRYLRLDGTAFDVETQSAPIVYDGARANQITSHDITELKRSAVERKEFERKLQETQKLESLGLLAGGIAHDFNNILTGILGNASLASLELPASSPVADNLKSIQQGSRRAADLCRQLLAYSGKGHLVVQNLSLNRLVEETAHLLKLSVSKKAVLHFDFHPQLPAIEADPTQIRQVIMNLVINASDAIGDASGVIRLSTGLAWIDRTIQSESGLLGSPELAEGSYAFLEVSDSGCGMSPETRARIFDPFFTTKFTGRGLGLSAVLGIVRSHRGALNLVSEPGRGTTFKLLFPCVAGDAEGVAPVREAKGAWSGRGCVLVVDDEATVRSTAVAMLRKLGFQVVLAADGLEAVEAFKAAPDRFALVMMDLTMPRMDGKQAFHEMRAVRGDIRAVMMSGFNEQEASRHFSGQEMAGFLQKPFAFEELSGVVQRVLAGAPDPGAAVRQEAAITAS
jgi:two-component system, cell cycle sensor histidine kinase and response regulator CckA